MKQTFFDWLDHRTGYRKIAEEALFENIPGGARWRYVWGSTLTFCFVTQVLTGFFLWMCYSPSAQTAWESVYYIQNEMAGGWFLRGIHHYTAQIFPVLLVLHLMQVVIDGAYKAPREINFWVGIILAKLILFMALTGYLLPWDQKGYWATKVATNIAASTPLIGPQLQRLAIGGAEYGHHTLTRFFALHAGVLPMCVAMLLGLHIYVFRRHTLTAKQPFKKPDTTFWPDQVLKDAVACLAVLAVILFFVLRHGIGQGAELYAPANPTEAFSAARPDWYFLFLFQTLKFVPEFVGAFLIPGVIFGVLMAMPIVGRWELGHRFNVGFLSCLLVGVAFMTYLAISEDASKPSYLNAVTKAQTEAERVKVLAHSPKGIPASGAITLLREDPLTQGPRLFAKHCASCHRFDGHNGLGAEMEHEPTASDLKHFARRNWLKGLLNPDQISSVKYFGGTKFRDGKMVKWVKKKVPNFDAEQKEMLRKVIAAVSAEAQLKRQWESDAKDATLIAEGRLLVSEIGCTDCHQFHEVDEDAIAPDLTGYGSRDWLIAMISNPAHERFYGEKNDRMPSFGRDEKLRPIEIEILADWLREDWYEKGDELKPVPVTAVARAEPTSPPSHPKAEIGESTPPDPQPPEDTYATPEETPPANPAVDPDTTAVPGFSKDVKPILEGSCFKCHGAEKQKGKLRLDSREAMLKGGEDRGPAIIPSDAAKSPLIILVSLPADHDDIMPSKGDPLTAAQIASLKQWIDAGAVWDAEPAATETKTGTVDFANAIKPIFEARCLKCHNAEKRKGKFLMTTKQVAFKGGDSELPAIVPGDPSASNMMKLISLDEDHDDIMPPKGGPLTADQIAAIRTWIAEGAHWPGGIELKAVE